MLHIMASLITHTCPSLFYMPPLHVENLIPLPTEQGGLWKCSVIKRKRCRRKEEKRTANEIAIRLLVR
jgi:hypothetical protein